MSLVNDNGWWIEAIAVLFQKDPDSSAPLPDQSFLGNYLQTYGNIYLKQEKKNETHKKQMHVKGRRFFPLSAWFEIGSWDFGHFSVALLTVKIN